MDTGVKSGVDAFPRAVGGRWCREGTGEKSIFSVGRVGSFAATAWFGALTLIGKVHGSSDGPLCCRVGMVESRTEVPKSKDCVVSSVLSLNDPEDASPKVEFASGEMPLHSLLSRKKVTTIGLGLVPPSTVENEA